MRMSTQNETLSREAIPSSEAVTDLQSFLTCQEFWEMSVMQVAKISFKVKKMKFSMILDISSVGICIEISTLFIASDKK